VPFVASFWQRAAMAVVVRQTLDSPNTGGAVGICPIGFIAYLAIARVCALLAAGVMATDGAAKME
jgi:hypothetical protein